MVSRSLLPFGLGRPRELATEPEGDPFRSFRREMDRLFDEFTRGWPFVTPFAEGEGRMLAPRIDVSETDAELAITAELPGIEDKDIDVTLSGNTLTIKGEKKAETERKAEDYHVMERSFGTFSRTIGIPFEADPDSVKAAFKHGVLTVKIPKPAEIKEKAKKIAIEHAA